MARKPMPKPTSFCFQVDGNAASAAIRMMTASMPLQPRSIETAKPLAVLWMI